MEKLIKFIKENKYSFLVAFVFYVFFLYFHFLGIRICDCEETQNQRNTFSSSSNRYSNYNHK